jgi:hypothetical protein
MANFTEISFANIKSEIENFLKAQYAKASLLYSTSSPYGQILSVVENLFQLSMLYIKNSIQQFDVTNPASVNERIIKNAAIYAGHIPTRSISATGTLLISIKTSTDVESTIPGGRITFLNRQLIKNKTNGLQYSINLGADKQTYKISNSTQIYLPIIQGLWSSQSFTGDGTENQTYQATIRSNQQEIEHFNFEVLVDGQLLTIYKNVYDMIPNEVACVVRTGFNGGIDIIFGNKGFGHIPTIGSVIQVNYLISDGSVGSIFRRTPNDWTFVDPAIDGYGNSIDLPSLFNIQIYTDINFGADSESIAFTKNLLPIVSNNFVLGLPQQFAYQIKKLGVFSHVNAYQSNEVIYIVATPNIVLFKNQNANYFTIDIRAFSLDSYEISKIDLYLKKGGNLLLTSKYQISSPSLSYYTINVFIITWSNAIDDNVNSQIIDTISQYFLNLNKIDRIPKSEIVANLSTITDIASVDLSFVCKDNEDYHRQAMLDDQNRRNQFASKDVMNISRPSTTYDSIKTIGLDPVLGDILFQPSDIPIIRGGWYDRNWVYYSDDIESSGLKSVNIIKTGSIDIKNKNQI